ncbi:C2 calcium/lipid-binding plant phosphoribosyltransferase familyprotein [Zostera marina]|uniref:C2 calcium/lipid-binding plant phosphoribosyltransferase familyprotein n=1 Tax=Zostera marina TaxID=29655 RepID=A0A0K9PFF7_ZOSMR|nr:C2 calcium/lipid-binding plant phosphoribosyltransferase familyprotein [Zostera marina]
MKVGVEVVSAMNLPPKDRDGSTSSYVEVVFDKQRFKTRVKEKDLNPVWNELFYFNLYDEGLLPEIMLEGIIYSTNKDTRTKSCIGKVRIAGTAIVPFSDAVVMHYPLERQKIFSRAKGELGLKVFVTNDPNVRVSGPGTPNSDLVDQYAFIGTPVTTPSPSPTNRRLRDERRRPASTFRSIPKDDDYDQKKNQYRPPHPVAVSYGAGEEVMRNGGMYSSSSSSRSNHSPMDYAYAIKQTSPLLGGGRNAIGGIPGRSQHHDLVESMEYLFVRIVKARDLPTMDITGSLDPYVLVKVGNYTGKTRMFEKQKNPEWNEVFAFSMDHLQADTVEILVKDKDLISDDFVGKLRIDIEELPERIPPDSPLAPEWYRLEQKKTEEKVKGDLMIAVWKGTQADEYFPDAWHSDTAGSPEATPIDSSNIRSKVYHSPRLWYVRVNIIGAQDLISDDKTRLPNAFVRARIGQQVFKTRPVQSQTLAPIWNEEYMFVAAEPFEDHLILTVEDQDQVMGSIHMPLQTIEKRVDDRQITSRWFDVSKSKTGDDDEFASKLHLRICLDGGYHVLDESTHYSSDLRPTARQLWKPAVGLLELGIISAEGLHPNKKREGKGTSDTYCVARYGQKWVRTRTVINSLTPRYNEQYTWEVFDPATVLTVGVFANFQLGEKSDSNSNEDAKIGKVRIRLSTLQTGRVYTNSYPLLVLERSGVKKMGELHLAIRFSSSSFVDIMHIYSRPLLPKMHYTHPLSLIQTDHLKEQAVKVVAARLGRMEPPLRREVVEYLSDFDSHLWSIRKSRANLNRLTGTFSNVIAIGKWFGGVCIWKNPMTTILVHILFLLLACFPDLILPTAFIYMFLIGGWNYRFRPQFPPHMNTSISQADTTGPDELDEEFDSFPCTGSLENVRRRYDRLRSVAGKVQRTVGDIAAQGERVQALISWRDPRATAIFMLFCLIAAGVLYVTPMQVVTVMVGFYLMRHPRLRGKMPASALNFFRRLPARTDCML